VQHALGDGVRTRGTVREILGESAAFFGEAVRWHHPVDEAQDASVCGGRTAPVNTISAAREAPIRDAMRWVPPAYGMPPATASIWPIWLASAAQMRSHPRHTSRAPA